jgi:hypothetical protein
MECNTVSPCNTNKSVCSLKAAAWPVIAWGKGMHSLELLTGGVEQMALR